MTTHRRLGMDWQASVASVAVEAAKAQKRSETASTGTVSRLRYETEKRSPSEVESIGLDDIRALFEDEEGV